MQAKETTDLFGVDISSLQSITDENLLFSKVNFIIFRAYGTNHASGGDTSFVNFVAKAKAHNCPCGSYFFGTPFIDVAAGVSTDAQITTNAQTQAQQYIDKLEAAFGVGNYGELTPMLDLESYTDLTTQYGHTATNATYYPMASGMTGAQVLTWVKAFRDYFWSKTKRRLGFYSNRYFLTTTDVVSGVPQGLGWTDAQMNQLSNMPLWLAEYDQWYGGTTGNVQPADLASWTKYAAWQFTGTGVASDYGVYHAKNQIDESRSKSLDYLRIPPAVTNLSVVQTSDTSVTVTFDKPTIVDYLGADLYVNNVWKKWINDSGVTQQSTTFDVTNYPKDTYIQFGVEIEDYCSDFSPMNSLNIKLVTAPTDPVPTPPPTTDPTVTDPPPPDPTTTLTPITESDVVLMPIAAMGTTIKKSTGSAIAGLTEIGGLELSSDTIDTTTLDSTGGYRQFMTSFKDAGEVSLSGHFEYTSHSTILDDFESGTTASYTITFPNGASWIFDGVVTKFQTGFSLEDLISFEATIKVSGAPTLTAPTP